jgi:hypothetical protein
MYDEQINKPAARGRRMQRWVAGTALLGAGALGGGILANSMMANAATTSAGSSQSTATGSGSSGTTSSGSTSSGTAANPPAHMGLDQSGTVTAVGTSSVTIGTTTYAVDASSDIDKSGESSLSSLVVGDAVTFNTVTTNGTVTVNKLHTGNEALNVPSGAPMGEPTGATSTGGTSTGGTSTGGTSTGATTAA